MKKKNIISEQAKDFTVEQLPHTRPQVFWDQVRNCPGKLLLSGLLLLLFALPLLATDFFADLSFASLTEALTSAYTAEGNTVQFFVNYQLHEVTVTLPQPVGGYTDSDLTDYRAPTDTWTLAPLSVVMLECGHTDQERRKNQ